MPFGARLIRLALLALIAIGIAASSLVLLSAPGFAADQHHTWKIYTNVRFRYSICYPQDLLVPQGEAENSDGQKFLAKDGAKLVVYGQNNALNESLQDMLEETATRLAGASGKVTYKVIQPGWFALSGQNGPVVFYAKTLYTHEQFKSFELTYDAATSAIYRPVITRLVHCFVNTAE